MSDFFETMRRIHLQERIMSVFDSNMSRVIYKTFNKFGILNVIHKDYGDIYEFDEYAILRLYDEHYDWFCYLEKIFLGNTHDEVYKLERKIEQLTAHIEELEERIACVPFGTKYQDAKESFDAQQHMLPSTKNLSLTAPTTNIV